MILNLNELQEASKTILFAIDSKNTSLYNETLELKAEGLKLTMHVTNREYLCSVSFDLAAEEKFHASVNAKLFLKLVSELTSDTIELNVKDTYLAVKGNGSYKIPLTFNDSTMLELPKIELNNITNSFSINTDALLSVITHNSKELQRGLPVKPVQSYYYIDEQGCITFTSGACVNNFNLEKPIKMLLTDKVVKLFKLFKDVSTVDFAIAQDQLTDNIVQTKVRFVSPTVTLTAILPDSSMITSVPVGNIRAMANKEYGNSVVVDTNELKQVLSRLTLFNNKKNYGKFLFSTEGLKITDFDGDNVEAVTYKNNFEGSYEALLNIDNLSLIVSTVEESTITLCFGDHRAFVIKKPAISDIIPEIRVS